MLIPLDLFPKTKGILSGEEFEERLDHSVFTERLRKTLYYGQTPTKNRPSLPVTEIAVGFLQDVAPRELGRVDLEIASDISREACIAPCSLMLGMIYVERLKHRNPEYLQQVSSSDLFLISMMMASKYLYDEGVDEEVFNDEWAESANMDVDEINTLEKDFLRAIDWQLFVKPADFFALLGRIEQGIAYRQSKDRGFHTYTDLLVLSQQHQIRDSLLALIRQLTKVMMVCSVAYVAGVMTIVASTTALTLIQRTQPPPLPIHFPTEHLLPSLPGLSFLSSLPSFTSLFPHSFTPLQSLIPSLPSLGSTEIDQKHLKPTSLLKSTTNGKSTNDGFEISENSSQQNVAEELNGNMELASRNQERRFESELKGLETTGDNVITGKQDDNRLSVSGLFTLSFLKDAILQFVNGLNDKSSKLDSEFKCTCGCCDFKTDQFDQRCVNISLGNSKSNPGFPHREMNVNLHPRRPHQQMNSNCHSYQCCCKPRFRSWSSEGNGKGILDFRFENVVLGFGTTAKPVVTR